MTVTIAILALALLHIPTWIAIVNLMGKVRADERNVWLARIG